MVILDFDGVIIDSVNEMMCSAFHLLTGSFVYDLAALPPHYVRLFRRNRFHVQPAGDLPPFAKWCLEAKSDETGRILTEEEYSSLLAADPVDGNSRRERFFASRGELIKRDRTAWVALNTPFEPLATTLSTLPEDGIIVLTNKNRSAVLEITGHYNLPVVDRNVYSGDGGTTKFENFQSIQKRFGLDAYVFVDDSVKNLREMRELVPNSKLMSLWLADWGYVGPNCGKEAKSLGFHVADQRDVADALLKGSPFRG